MRSFTFPYYIYVRLHKRKLKKSECLLLQHPEGNEAQRKKDIDRGNGK